MEERKVKGSLLAIQARFIRANKDKDWNNYLKPEDWEIINGRVLPSVWYPFDTFRRCGEAVFEQMAGGNYNNIRRMGKESMGLLASGIYRSLPLDSGPIRALSEMVKFIGYVFNFGDWSLDHVSDNNVKIHFSFGEKDSAVELFCHLMIGAFEQLVEAGGGSGCVFKVERKEWEDSDETVFDIKWS